MRFLAFGLLSVITGCGTPDVSCWRHFKDSTRICIGRSFCPAVGRKVVICEGLSRS